MAMAEGALVSEETAIVVARLSQLAAVEEDIGAIDRDVKALTVEAVVLAGLARRLRARTEPPTWRS